MSIPALSTTHFVFIHPDLVLGYFKTFFRLPLTDLICQRTVVLLPL
jgi:hypothetical protein